MDIKDLNKPQLILLAVLLSFITSIATGITTVTLMERAPTSFTVPVNRVIKQTVEKIQQVEGKTTVQTVIVKEEDLIVDAIEKNKKAVFVVTREVQNEELKTVEIGAGRALAMSSDGTVVADANLVPGKGTYFVKNESGKFKAEFMSTDKGGFSFLKIGAPLDEKNTPPEKASKLAFTLPEFGDLSKMKAGQKILVLGNSITSFMFEGAGLNINGSKSNAGAPVVNLDGEVLGIALSGLESTFVPINAINDALKPKSPETPKADAPKAL